MTTAIQKANELIGAQKVKELMDAGICLSWYDEYAFLFIAANMKEQDIETYKKLDSMKKPQD